MVALGFFSLKDSLVAVLAVTLGILVLIIAYRKWLAYLGKGTPKKQEFCVLYSLEKEPASGELEFYFTTEEKRNIQFLILDADMNEVCVVAEKESFKGGNILRFDSSKLKNGSYFYCLKTENQKTMKKMLVDNRLV